MASVMDSLLLALGLDSTDLKKGLDEAEHMTQGAGKKMADSIMGPLKTAVAGLAAGFGLKAMIGQFTSQADAIGKLADSMDVNVEELQAWGEAAIRAGGSAEAFQNTFKSLNSQINVLAATGKSRLLPIFEQMGINAKDASGKTKDTFTILSELAGKAETMGKAEFAGLAQRLGVDHGTIMLLQSGQKNVDALIKRQKLLGGYTKEDTLIAAKFNDAMADLGQGIRSISAIFIGPLVNAMAWVLNKLVDFQMFLLQHKPFMIGFFTILAAVILANAIPALISLATAAWAAMAPFLPFIAIAAALALAFDDLWAFITGGESVLERIMRRFGVTQQTIDSIRATLRSVAEFFMDLWDAIAGEGVEADEAWERVKTAIFNAWEGIKSAVVNAVNYLINTVKNFGNTIVESIQSAWNSVVDYLGSLSLVESGKKLIMTFIDGIKNAAGALVDSVKDVFGKVREYLPFSDAHEGPFSDLTLSGERLMQTIGTGAKQGGNGLLDAVTGIFDKVGNAIGGFDVGLGMPAPALASAGAVTTITTSIGNITVQTQATDANGIASGLGSALKNSSFGGLVPAAQTGVIQK